MKTTISPAAKTASSFLLYFRMKWYMACCSLRVACCSLVLLRRQALRGLLCVCGGGGVGEFGGDLPVDLRGGLRVVQALVDFASFQQRFGRFGLGGGHLAEVRHHPHV